MKRFWTRAEAAPAEGGHAILLDGRQVHTPGRVALVVPTTALAGAIAAEWDAVTDAIEPRAMRLTGLANAAVERIAPDPARFARDLAAYGETDLLCYRAEAPPPLVRRQAEAWDPWLDWARRRYDVHFEIASGVMHVAQPPATLARLADAVAAQGPFALAALSPVVTITGSLVLGLVLAEGAGSADALWDAAEVDEAWQAEQWGDDPLALAARAARRADYDAAARFLTLAAG